MLPVSHLKHQSYFDWLVVPNGLVDKATFCWLNEPDIIRIKLIAHNKTSTSSLHVIVYLCVVQTHELVKRLMLMDSVLQ